MVSTVFMSWFKFEIAINKTKKKREQKIAWKPKMQFTQFTCF